MDQIRCVPEKRPEPNSTEAIGTGEAAGTQRVHGFTREEHQAIHALTLCPFALKPIGWKTLLGTYVRKEIIEGFEKLGLVEIEAMARAKNKSRFVKVAALTERGKMVAQELGAPGVFPMKVEA